MQRLPRNNQYIRSNTKIGYIGIGDAVRDVLLSVGVTSECKQVIIQATPTHHSKKETSAKEVSLINSLISDLTHPKITTNYSFYSTPISQLNTQRIVPLLLYMYMRYFRFDFCCHKS